MKGSEENLHRVLRLAKSGALRNDFALIGVDQIYWKFQNDVDVWSTPEDSAR